jgi:hypothetical protein
MEEFKNRQGANARVNMVLGAVYQVAIVAIVAVIVFADIAVASDSTKRLVFTSNALLVFQNDSKDMTAAEKATALGSSEVKQPWLVYQIYVLALTVATIVFIVTSIY